jgi:hypothetical protein
MGIAETHLILESLCDTNNHVLDVGADSSVQRRVSKQTTRKIKKNQ